MHSVEGRAGVYFHHADAMGFREFLIQLADGAFQEHPSTVEKQDLRIDCDIKLDSGFEDVCQRFTKIPRFPDRKEGWAKP